jgi:hypothetical protein
MENPDFPSNSNVSKEGRIDEEKDIQRVTSGQATRRKKSLGRKFKETFIAGDAKTALSYSLVDILFPMVRDTIAEAAQEGIRMLILGDYRRRGTNPPPSGPTGYVNYRNYSTQMGGSRSWTPISSPHRALSRRARSQHDFDELLLDSRSEAEQVIDQLFDVVSRYDTATVADLYELVGLASNHTDHKWGWTDLRGAGVTRTRDGYLLDLPDPIPL